MLLWVSGRIGRKLKMWTLKDSFYFFILAWVVVSVFLIVVNLFLKKNLKSRCQHNYLTTEF